MQRYGHCVTILLKCHLIVILAWRRVFRFIIHGLLPAASIIGSINSRPSVSQKAILKKSEHVAKNKVDLLSPGEIWRSLWQGWQPVHRLCLLCRPGWQDPSPELPKGRNWRKIVFLFWLCKIFIGIYLNIYWYTFFIQIFSDICLCWNSYKCHTPKTLHWQSGNLSVWCMGMGWVRYGAP